MWPLIENLHVKKVTLLQQQLVLDEEQQHVLHFISVFVAIFELKIKAIKLRLDHGELYRFDI